MRIWIRGLAFLLLSLFMGALIAPGAYADDDENDDDREERSERDDDDKKEKRIRFLVTLLHNNDAESQLIDAGSGIEDFGGIARFATVVDDLRRQARRYAPRRVKAASFLCTSGDNFLAGPEFSVSLEGGVPFFDSIGADLIGYDVMCIGNHEFDFGPDTLADFILGFSRRRPKFLSANLDFSGEPRLRRLARQRRILPSHVVRRNGVQVGFIGLTTPELPFISSPRNVEVSDALARAVQRQANRLTRRGAKIIVLVSHLQAITEELALIEELRGVDIIVGGGGGELLANDGDLLVPGDEGEVFGPYPLFGTDAEGIRVPVVTTSGDFRYVGRLVAGFTKHGRLTRVFDKSGPVRVAGGSNPDAVSPDAAVQAQVVDPVAEALEEIAANVIADSEVGLDGVRGNVRTVETNLGNLIADALLDQATQLAGNFGAPVPDVALQNGGGIRNDSVIGPGDVTELDTFDILPFSNLVSIVPGVTRQQFKEILENAVSGIPGASGRFAQVGGFEFTYDASGTAQVLDADGNVTTAGTRVREVVLDDGTVIVQNGAVVAGDDIVVATIDFLARGGDQYPFRGLDFTSVGVSYQQALFNHIVDALGGQITAADYPEGGEGRITRLN